MAKRKIIKIDEDKCNGCGLCIPNCQEGALQIINGKAKLIKESFCDGLGACLGHCPQGAISIEEKEAEEYKEECACPGAKITDFRNTQEARKPDKNSPGSMQSQLSHWPVQLKLVPAFAPFLNESDLLITADCVPFAYAGFHEDLLRGRVLLVGCPKFDDLKLYQEKISQIIQNNKIKSITYARMEVPCCFGLVNIIKAAILESKKEIPFKEAVISIKGERIR